MVVVKKLSDFLVRFKDYRSHCIHHWCPACKELHPFAVDKPFSNGARWTWNGKTDKPTFSPSMNITVGPHGEEKRIERCHYWLRDGRIQYLPDCTHEMKGKTIDLPPIPADKWQLWNIENPGG